MSGHFEVNDRISFSGAEGTITNITTDKYALMYEFPIHAVMDNGMHLHFTLDGKFMKTQKYPVIVKIGKVKPPIKGWVVAYLADGKWNITEYPLSDSEIKEHFSNIVHQKIDESMVEFPQ